LLKHLVTWSLAILATVAFGIVAFIAAVALRAFAQAPAPQFGSSPSGEVPILFNDQHVYSKPDKLKQGRVLAALVREDHPGSATMSALQLFTTRTGDKRLSIIPFKTLDGTKSRKRSLAVSTANGFAKIDFRRRRRQSC
jgi:hypothetical protein